MASFVTVMQIVALQNPFFVFLTKSSPKQFVSSTILTAPNLSNLFTIFAWFEIFQSFQILLRALLPEDQGDYSCSSKTCQDHQKLDSLTPFQKFHCLIHEFYPTNHHSSPDHAYNLPTFKSKVNKLDLISLSTKPFFLLSFIVGAVYRLP